MSNSNTRIFEYNTVHHLTSRIAHSVFFLKEEERNDFIEQMLRVTDFTGLQLLGWCIMSNHFHILVFLPVPPTEISEEEVLRRYGRLKGMSGKNSLLGEIERLRSMGGSGEEQARKILDGLRRKMYSVSLYMKILKQWFTEEYNKRFKHCGTLWEAPYHDRVIKELGSFDCRDCLAYIHLNPVRAAITSGFFDYGWSSLAAAERGDAHALDGMRLVYGEELSKKDLMDVHADRMRLLLAKWKDERALEIARKRAAGFDIPADGLTNEAMIAQAMRQIAEVQKTVVELHALRNLSQQVSGHCEILRKEIAAILFLEPQIETAALAARVGASARTVNRYLRTARETLSQKV